MMLNRVLLLMAALLISHCCEAPGLHILFVPISTPYYRYTDCPLERAFIRLESNFNPEVVNVHSGATGILQITPVMINDINRIAKIIGLNRYYTMHDALKPERSLEIFRLAIIWYNPVDTAEIVRIWFGRGIQHDGWTWQDYYKRLIELMKN